MMKFTNYLRTWLKIKKTNRFRPFCLCPPDVMFVTRGSKSSLFYVFDSFDIIYISGFRKNKHTRFYCYIARHSILK